MTGMMKKGEELVEGGAYRGRRLKEGEEPGVYYLAPAVSAARNASPGAGSDWSFRILSICCSISRGNSSRPS